MLIFVVAPPADVARNCTALVEAKVVKAFQSVDLGTRTLNRTGVGPTATARETVASVPSP